MNDSDSLCYTGGELVDILRERNDALPSTTARNVILFGGTFEPPHVGHLTMAQLALEQTSADEVWFLPAPRPPHKDDVDDHTFAWRVQMVEALIAGRKGLRAMPIEALLPRPSYSVDTVRACRTWYPDVSFWFLIGADSLSQLPTWHRIDHLARAIDFVVASRTGFPFEETFATVKNDIPDLRATQIEMPLLDVSSTWLRDRFMAGLDVCNLVPTAVRDVWMKGR